MKILYNKLLFILLLCVSCYAQEVTKSVLETNTLKNNNELSLTKTEKLYLQNHPTLRVQNFLSFPPYNFNERGDALGYTIDYLNLLAEILGVRIEYISGKTWIQYLEMIKKDEIDILPNIAITEERKKFIDYTQFIHFYYQTSLTIPKGSDIQNFTDLKGKTLAILDKSFLHTILAKNYPNQKLYLAPTLKAKVLAVSNGQADAAIGNLATLEYSINQNWLSNLKSIKLSNEKNLSNSTPLYMGVKKGNTTLKSLLEKAHILLPLSKVLALKEKWLNMDSKHTVKMHDEEYRYLENIMSPQKQTN